MREVLRNGQTQPRVRLADVAATPGAIAVGALAGLGGEVTMVEGEVWVARSTGDGAAVSGPECRGDDQATLLAVAHVDAWRSIPLQHGDSALGKRIGSTAAGAGVDTSRPFPFIVEGDLTSLEAHVIAGSCPIANPDGEEPWRFSVTTPTPGRLVGFYAEDSDGVMTHHGDVTHTHVVLKRNGRTITAHADHADVGPGAVLHLPAD
jgi:acetolactate decarboxylase